ncbi:MAG: dihydrodipicolinate synthase family protein [Opitutaceae bacterium]|nr:dihydrodipicolinate synthase family protein [Opitutaceae bacterium]
MNIKSGVYPVMLTPFSGGNKIDYESLLTFIRWLEEGGADGLFAVCQSSEMFALSVDERVELAGFVKENSNLDVIASGHVDKSFEEQLETMYRIADTGVDAVVLLSNAFTQEGENDDILIENLDRFLSAFKTDTPLGMYECPQPYKRLLSDRVLEYLLSSGRFIFLKDTSCDISTISRRLDMMKGANFGLYNAHAGTLIESLKLGGTGYSGVHSNFSIKLMSYLCRHFADSEKASEAAEILARIDTFQRNNLYPICAKEMLKYRGIFKTIETRTKDTNLFEEKNRSETEFLLKNLLEFETRLKL